MNQIRPHRKPFIEKIEEVKKVNQSDSEIKIGVVGFPSNLGGADTELFHQIICWRKMGVSVTLCHTGGFDNNCLKKKEEVEKMGCIVPSPKNWESLEGLHVISFCNGEFLNNLEEIKKYARTTTFVNCMTWNFEKEIDCQRRGLIDFNLYQTEHQFNKVSQKLKEFNKYTPILFKPYFDTSFFKYKENRENDQFRFGRISRGDSDKYGKEQFWIYETMTAPCIKQGLILGWDNRAIKKFNNFSPPDWIKCYPEGGITQQDFYNFCDVLIMQTETFENLPRVGFEAMASGTVLVVDNRGGWKVLVEDGKTGWLCNNDREFVYKCSRIAHEVQEKEDMRGKAKEKLEKEWGLETSIKSWENVFKI